MTDIDTIKFLLDNPDMEIKIKKDITNMNPNYIRISIVDRSKKMCNRSKKMCNLINYEYAIEDLSDTMKEMIISSSIQYMIEKIKGEK